MTGEEFLGRLDYYGNAWLPARDVVATALKSRLNIDPSGRIVLFEQFAPWKVQLCLIFLLARQYIHGLSRSISSNSNPSWLLRQRTSLSTSFTLMNWQGHGAFKLFLSVRTASKVAKLSQRHGAGCAMMTCYVCQVLQVESSCMRPASSVATRRKMALLRWRGRPCASDLLD